MAKKGEFMSLSGDIKAASRASQMVSQGHSSAPGWHQQIARMWPRVKIC